MSDINHERRCHVCGQGSVLETQRANRLYSIDGAGLKIQSSMMVRECDHCHTLFPTRRQIAEIMEFNGVGSIDSGVGFVSPVFRTQAIGAFSRDWSELPKRNRNELNNASKTYWVQLWAEDGGHRFLVMSNPQGSMRFGVFSDADAKTTRWIFKDVNHSDLRGLAEGVASMGAVIEGDDVTVIDFNSVGEPVKTRRMKEKFVPDSVRSAKMSPSVGESFLVLVESIESDVAIVLDGGKVRTHSIPAQILSVIASSVDQMAKSVFNAIDRVVDSGKKIWDLSEPHFEMQHASVGIKITATKTESLNESMRLLSSILSGSADIATIRRNNPQFVHACEGLMGAIARSECSAFAISPSGNHYISHRKAKDIAARIRFVSPMDPVDESYDGYFSAIKFRESGGYFDFEVAGVNRAIGGTVPVELYRRWVGMEFEISSSPNALYRVEVTRVKNRDDRDYILRDAHRVNDPLFKNQKTDPPEST